MILRLSMPKFVDSAFGGGIYDDVAFTTWDSIAASRRRARTSLQRYYRPFHHNGTFPGVHWNCRRCHASEKGGVMKYCVPSVSGYRHLLGVGDFGFRQFGKPDDQQSLSPGVIAGSPEEIAS